MPTTKEVSFNIPALNIQSMPITIYGTNPLIFHKWSEKAMKMILDKQQKKATKGREIRDPEKDIEESFYYLKDGRVGFPALSVKQAIVNAARQVDGVPMTLIRGAIFVEGLEDGLIPVEYEEKTGRQDMVRVGQGTADLRFRGQLKGWKMTFNLTWNGDVFSAEQVINLLRMAGFSCGLGEWRPERNGDFGTFSVATPKE